MNLRHLINRLAQTLRAAAVAYQSRQRQRHPRQAFLADQKARVLRGEIPPRFRSYEEYTRSYWWQRLRDHTLAYLSHTCEFCGSRATQVHHVRYPPRENLGGESIRSLYAVCHRCHDVAHGLDVGNSADSCAFCDGAALATLNIRIPKFKGSMQRVCQRCESLASGYRGQANRWPQSDYDKWVEHWRSTLPPPASLKAREVGPSARESREGNKAFRNQARTDAVRDAVLARRKDELSSFTTEELEARWAKRGELELDEDEVMLLRWIIRKRLGISA